MSAVRPDMEVSAEQKRVWLRRYLSELLLSPWTWLPVALILLQPILLPALIYAHLKAAAASSGNGALISEIVLLALSSLAGWVFMIRSVLRCAHARKKGLFLAIDHRAMAIAHSALLLIIAPAVCIAITSNVRDIGREGHVITRQAQIDNIAGLSLAGFYSRLSREN